MIDPIALIAAATAFFVIAASPGPAVIGVSTVSMRAGRPAGIRFGLGLTVGLAFWGMIAATGLGAVLQASVQALTVMKVVGGIYLLWLALGSARAAARPEAATDAVVADGRWFWRGLILNLSNPKAVLAWMATLSLGIGEAGGIWQVALVLVICVLLGAVIYTAYALAFSTSGAMGIYARLRRWVDGVAAGLFALAGLALLRSALDRD